MADFDVASSGADSVGAADMAADLDAMDMGGSDTPDAAVEDAEDSLPEAEGELEPAAEDESPIEDAPAEEEDPAPVEAAKDENGEELPEGVTTRERNGKEEWSWPKPRAQAIYSAYKTAQTVEGILGEPLTPEAIETRHNAFVQQESMIADFMSGDPGSESRFLSNLAKWSKSARDNGEVEHSPLRNIANQFPQFLLKSGDKEAFDAMAAPVFRAQFDEMYAEATAAGDDNLLFSLQRLDNRLFGSYKKKAEITAPDPLKQREADLKAREDRLNQTHAERSRAELQDWQAKTTETIVGAVDDAIVEHLGANVVKSYEKFPTDFTAIKASLRVDLQGRLKSDQSWQTELKKLDTRAANAKSPEVRESIREELKTRYQAKARFWMNPVRNPKVKEIMTQRAASIKATSDAKHQRHAESAARREPGTVGTPTRQTIRETPNGRSTREDWDKAIDAL